MKIAATLIPVLLLFAIIGFSLGTDIIIPSSNPLGPPQSSPFGGHQTADAGVSNAADSSVPADSSETEEVKVMAQLN